MVLCPFTRTFVVVSTGVAYWTFSNPPFRSTFALYALRSRLSADAVHHWPRGTTFSEKVSNRMGKLGELPTSDDSATGQSLELPASGPGPLHACPAVSRSSPTPGLSARNRKGGVRDREVKLMRFLGKLRRCQPVARFEGPPFETEKTSVSSTLRVMVFPASWGPTVIWRPGRPAARPLVPPESGPALRAQAVAESAINPSDSTTRPLEMNDSTRQVIPICLDHKQPRRGSLYVPSHQIKFYVPSGG
jgi:hypothetical protein